MITPSYSTTATERVLPRLAIDFTTANLDSRITFTRTTDSTNPATYINRSGIIVNATNNQPRFDYNPTTLSCNGLLIEESRTNSLKYSEQFDNAFWTKNNSSISATKVTSPDGLVSGQKLVEAATTSEHSVSVSVAYVSGTSYTLSVFAKQAERPYLVVSFGAAAFGSTTRAWFNLSNGTVGTLINSPSASITSLGNGWYRCSITKTATASISGNTIINSSTADNVLSYTGDGTSGLYIWGAQLEAGAFPTSYIPTTTTALTRNADVATMTGTNFSSWYNASEGAFFIRMGFPTILTSRVGINVNDNTTSNRMTIGTNPSTASTSRINVTNGGVSQAAIGNGSTFANNVFSNIVFAYKQNSFSTSANALAPNTDSLGNVPIVDRLNIGEASSAYLNGWVSKIMYWPQRLLDAEVQAFSK